MKTKYTNKVEDGIAVMTLYGEIGGPGYQAEYFTAEMKYHNGLGRGIKVYINSPGGSVFGGYALIQAILDYEADTHIVGLAASMGGIIAQFGKKRTMNDFAVGMIHMPSSKGKSNDKLLNMVADQLLNILEARCKKPRAELEQLMKDETFFDASEMLAMGFVDEVISTSVSPVENIDSFTTEALYDIYNSIIKTNKMEKLISHFKLENNAGEELILEKVTNLENDLSDKVEEISAKDSEISKLQAELEEMRTDHQELTETLANQVVDDAITNGKIEKSKKDIWVEAAKKDPQGVKAQLESISASKSMSVQSFISKDVGKTKDKPEDDIVNWVRNNGAELLKLEKDDPDRFQELMNLYSEKTSF